jgi:hypothetical protein
MFRGDAKNTKKCNQMYRTKQIMGKMSVFTKKIPLRKLCRGWQQFSKNEEKVLILKNPPRREF